MDDDEYTCDVVRGPQFPSIEGCTDTTMTYFQREESKISQLFKSASKYFTW